MKLELRLNEWAEFVVKFVPWSFIPWVILLAIILAIGSFWYWFYKPAIYLNKSLNSIIHQLKQHNKEAKIDFDYITDNIIKNEEPFKHLWKEFSETLHEYKEQGSDEIKIRATIPAEGFFTKDIIVDSKLNSDFFKHLPGILTGLGIIATFAGLIYGLSGFVPSEDASTVRTSLTSLLGGVKHAFLFSVVAIISAMFITFFEKKILANLYKKVEELCTEIDKLYDMGVGEEYLARLVKSSESSYTQTAQLKDILVNDLKELFTNLVDKQVSVMQQHHHQQIEANKEQSQNLGNVIANSINESLAPTLSTLSQVVEKASGEQSSAVSGMLEDILHEFMQQIKDTFGSQANSINDGLAKSMESMSTMQSEISNLINSIKTSSQNATDSMSDKLANAMENASISQNTMNEQMREFVNQIKDMLLNQQTKSQEVLDKSVNGVLEQLNISMQKLAEDKIATQNQAKQNQEAMSGQMQDSIQQIKDIMLSQQTKSQEVLDQSVNGVLEQLNISMQKLAEDKIATQNQAKQNQEAMSGQMQDSIQQTKDIMLNQQTKSQEVLDQSVNGVLEQLNIAMQKLAEDKIATQHIENERHNNLKQQTQELYSRLSNEVASLISKINESITKADANIYSLQNVTTKALNDMSVGANSINQAADKFANSSNSISNVFTKVDNVSNQLNSTSQILDKSAQSVALAFEQYDKTRATIERITLEFKNILDNSSAEAKVKRDLIAEMENIISNVKKVEQETSEYLDKFNDVLNQSFESFAQQMSSQLANSIVSSDTHTAKSIISLTAIMQELDDVLQNNMPKNIKK